MLRIVVIDDEKWIRKLIIKILPYDKFPITVVGEAEDGKEALELITRVKPDIILTDIRMPILSGLELVQKLNSKLPDSQIIIISGYDSFDYAQSAIKYGVIDFLLKPVEEIELEKAITKAQNNINKLNELNKKRTLEKKVKRLSGDYVEVLEDDFIEISNDKIRKALIYIHGNYSNQISLNDVSDAVYINSSYFSKLFKTEVGLGFNKYLMDLRFKEAKKLLKEKRDLTIGDISTIVGFLDSNYFSRLFRKRFGMPPQEYRD